LKKKIYTSHVILFFFSGSLFYKSFYKKTMPRGLGKKSRSFGIMRTCEQKRNKEAWVAYWYDEDRIIKRKRFSIKKYGETEAQALAQRTIDEVPIRISHSTSEPVTSGEHRVIRVLGHDFAPGSRRKYRVQWADHSITLEPRRNLVDVNEDGELIVNEALQKYWDRKPNLSRKV
jgi:hypothetical protein